MYGSLNEDSLKPKFWLIALAAKMWEEVGSLGLRSRDTWDRATFKFKWSNQMTQCVISCCILTKLGVKPKLVLWLIFGCTITTFSSMFFTICMLRPPLPPLCVKKDCSKTLDFSLLGRFGNMTGWKCGHVEFVSFFSLGKNSNGYKCVSSKRRQYISTPTPRHNGRVSQ